MQSLIPSTFGVDRKSIVDTIKAVTARANFSKPSWERGHIRKPCLYLFPTGGNVSFVLHDKRVFHKSSYVRTLRNPVLASALRGRYLRLEHPEKIAAWLSSFPETDKAETQMTISAFPKSAMDSDSRREDAHVVFRHGRSSCAFKAEFFVHLEDLRVPVVIVREKSGQGGVSIERKYLQDIFRRAGILKGEALHFYDGYIVAHNDIAIFQQVFNFGVPDCTLPNPSDIASWLKELPKETKSLKVSFDESSFVFSDGKNHFEAETNPLNINVGIRSYLDNLFCGRPGYTKFTVAPDTCKDAIITGKSMEEDNCVILHRRMNAISGKFNKYFDFAGFDISLFEKTVNAIGKNHNIVFELSEIHGNAPFAVIYSDGSDFRFYLVGYAREYVIDHVPPVAWLEFDATPDGFFDEFQAALEAMPIPAIAEPITETATATTTPGTVAPVEPAKPETSASATPAEQTAPKPETATVHANRFIYAEITDRIVRELEKGIVPWKKPWKSGCGRPKNLLTGKEYNGVNFWLLQIMPYISPYWLTWKQAEKMGGTVKPRQKPCPIVFWKRYLKEDRETGDAELRQFLKISAVYNLEQIDDIEAPETVVIPEVNGIESAEKIIAAMPNKPKISDNGAKAVYYPLEDLVVTPNIKYFKTAEGYYGTLFHELGHSTGHKTRLARKELMTAAAFGSEVYSKEELTAELCAAFLCAECRIEETTIENSSAYIGGWLKKLKDDKTLFFMAAQRAQKAADYILDRKADYGE